MRERLARLMVLCAAILALATPSEAQVYTGRIDVAVETSPECGQQFLVGPASLGFRDGTPLAARAKERFGTTRADEVGEDGAPSEAAPAEGA